MTEELPETCYGCKSLAKRLQDADRKIEQLLGALTDCSVFLNDHRHGSYMHTFDLMQEREMLSEVTARTIAEVGFDESR